MRRRLETRSADCCTRALLSYPSWKKAAGWLFFLLNLLLTGGRGRERERLIQWMSVFSLFLNPKVETCLGSCTSSGGGCLCLVFFSFPSFFLMRWMAEVLYCELGKNCQFRWSTESSSSLCIRFFFNKQQLTAERRAPSTGTLLKPVCLFSISLVPAVFDKKLYPGQLGSFSRGCRSQDFCFASVTAALLLWAQGSISTASNVGFVLQGCTGISSDFVDVQL